MSVNQWLKYAQTYNCSIAQAIADRDEPMNLATCIKEFTVAAGRAPTVDELHVMRPDNQTTINEQLAYYRE